LVDAPLLEGQRYPFKFFNFKNGKTFFLKHLDYATVIDSSQKPRPISCPHFYIYDYTDNQCILDILEPTQSPQGFLVRGKEDAHFSFRLDDLRFKTAKDANGNAIE